MVSAVFLGAGVAAAQETETAPVAGRLVNAGEPVAEAVVRIFDDAGEEVGTATSDERGRWNLDLPLGTYTFEVDPQSLPEGVSVQSNVTRDVAAGRTNTVVFLFGEVRTSIETPLYERVIRLVIDGLRFGLVIAVAAIGLSLIFGTTGLTNFAHGELVTLGAVFTWMFNVTFGIPLVGAAVLGIIAGVGVGWLNNAGVWHPLRRRRVGLIPQLVVSIGLAISLRYLILALFSDRTQAFAESTVSHQRQWGPIAITDTNLLTIGISLVVLIAVALMLQKTPIGKAMRAVADNKDLAAASGINVERVITFVWCLGGGLAALGGVLLALSELGGRVQWEMGFKLLLLMFAGIILGGLGTAYGALLGCLIVGMLVQLSTLVINPDLKYVGGLLILIFILVVRPQGLLGSRERVG
ncbi:MAG: branched-chain amino acid ABC transporter permease [Actinomycetia bacterium]|nr:branched-chain amino acid ABC transporter permease [Actinomycetes bacterium]MCH9709709.1 branched-chain amino acid ABC transporter permease [Actinomycetes bacterium]